MKKNILLVFSLLSTFIAQYGAVSSVASRNIAQANKVAINPSSWLSNNTSSEIPSILDSNNMKTTLNMTPKRMNEIFQQNYPKPFKSIRPEYLPPSKMLKTAFSNPQPFANKMYSQNLKTSPELETLKKELQELESTKEQAAFNKEIQELEPTKRELHELKELEELQSTKKAQHSNLVNKLKSQKVRQQESIKIRPLKLQRQSRPFYKDSETMAALALIAAGTGTGIYQTIKSRESLWLKHKYPKGDILKLQLNNTEKDKHDSIASFTGEDSVKLNDLDIWKAIVGTKDNMGKDIKPETHKLVYVHRYKDNLNNDLATIVVEPT